jgi:hypothetical protein
MEGIQSSVSTPNRIKRVLSFWLLDEVFSFLPQSPSESIAIPDLHKNESRLTFNTSKNRVLKV